MCHKLGEHERLGNQNDLSASIDRHCNGKGEPDIKSYGTPELYHTKNYTAFANGTKQILFLSQTHFITETITYVCCLQGGPAFAIPTTFRLLTVQVLVKSDWSRSRHPPKDVDRGLYAACLSKETHTTDDGQLASFVSLVAHKCRR